MKQILLKKLTNGQPTDFSWTLAIIDCKMDRQRIKIELDVSDWTMEIIGATFLVLMIGFPLYYFNELPNTIPIHFNGSGEADGFSQKNTVWTLPVIGLVIYIGMLILNRYPHILNYPREITEENARMFIIPEGTKLEDIVKSINAVGTAPGDLMAILEGLKQAGALKAELIVI